MDFPFLGENNAVDNNLPELEDFIQTQTFLVKLGHLWANLMCQSVAGYIAISPLCYVQSLRQSKSREIKCKTNQNYLPSSFGFQV